jgi:N-acetylneuraminate lyase
MVPLTPRIIPLTEDTNMKQGKLTGLVAATHTPFGTDGSLHLAAVEAQAAHLLRNRIHAVFIAGSTGECHSLTLAERLQLTRQWVEVSRGAPLQVAVHVGSNCLADAQALARQAGELEVAAIAALAPSYFRPRTLAGLVEWCAAIAAAAPQTPFYYYDIPTLTGVNFPMVDFLARAADRIPTLAGIKFTSYDLFSYQLCLNLDKEAFDVLWGADEALLAALAVGARNAIGTSYNYAAPVYHRMLQAVQTGKWELARQEQYRIAQLIHLFVRYGVLPATKVLVGMLGVEVGPARPPHENLTAEQRTVFRKELEKLGFFDWINGETTLSGQLASGAPQGCGPSGEQNS